MLVPVKILQFQDMLNESVRFQDIANGLPGQDYAIDLCGTLDVLQPVILLMLKTQSVNLPPWKIVTWFRRVIKILKELEANLVAMEAGAKPSEQKLLKLSKHWEELTPPASSEDEGEDEVDYGNFQVTVL